MCSVSERVGPTDCIVYFVCYFCNLTLHFTLCLVYMYYIIAICWKLCSIQSPCTLELSQSIAGTIFYPVKTFTFSMKNG